MDAKYGRRPVLLFFIAMLLLFSLAVFAKESGDYHHMRDRAYYVTNSQVSKLQSVLDTLLQKTQTLEMLVVESGGNIRSFDNICKTLLDNSAIRSLQLAPNGVVSMVYPLKGNEDAFGDLFDDPDRAKEAIYARDSGQLTMSGPFKLYQGGFGVVARRPIYLQNAQSQKEFWGFSIIVLDLPAAFAPAELDQLVAEGYSYKLHRMHPDTNATQVIDESSASVLQNPIDISFPVPGTTWTFSVAPTAGWFSAGKIIAEAVLGIALSVLFVLLFQSYLVMRHQRSEMQNLSLTDSLTGLYNRRMLSKTLANFIGDSMPFALFFLDLDGFKQVNDTYGHNAGDLFLIECVKRLVAYSRGEYYVFRNGGDEFSLIVPKSMTSERCKRVQNEARALFDKPIVIDGNVIPASISIGYSIYPTDAQTTDEVLHIADQGMYSMKKNYYLSKSRKCKP
ncbi:MAG: diguanylate cyclase [Clostridia bacterium]